MARPRKIADNPQTRDLILKSARLEFAARGISAPLDAIAERCGIRRSSLLHHFKSKNLLIDAVIEDILEKARTRLVDAIAAGNNDYTSSMNAVVAVLRNLEDEEQGVAGMLTHCMLTEDEAGPVTKRAAEFIEVIQATILMAGAGRNRTSDEIKAVIAHLVVGEITRAALGSRATQLWGPADGVNPLFNAYFIGEAK